MKTVRNTSKISVENTMVGMTYQYRNIVYMRIFIPTMYSEHLFVNVKTGHVSVFAPEVLVSKVDTKLYIQ